MKPARGQASSAPARETSRTRALKLASWLVLLGLLLAWVIRSDTAHALRVAQLSAEGSAPPERDAHSTTGYTLGQRHFLGTHERGETYRWIAATQHGLAEGLFTPAPAADNVPLGRPDLAPRLYKAWLAICTWSTHIITGEPLALCAERIALWEPAITHALAFCAAVALFWRRFGPPTAAVVGLVLAAFPPVLAQFLPGVLTPRTWALLLAAVALIPPVTKDAATPHVHPVCKRSALLAALALWLTPAIGFPAVIVIALSGALAAGLLRSRVPFLSWSCLGAAMTLGGWLIDGSPWDPAVGELRTIHPLYACAWLGLGLCLDGWQRLRTGTCRRLWPALVIAGGAVLLAALVYAQIAHHYPGWLYPSASLRRLTSLDETAVYLSAATWLVQAPLAETLGTLAPIMGALSIFAATLLRARRNTTENRGAILAAVAPLIATLAFGLFQLRLLVIAALAAVPLMLALASGLGPVARRIALVASWAILVTFMAAGKRLPTALNRSADATTPEPADIQAMVHRHFARWMATHHAPGSIAALAPPELSDSLAFHGGCRVLMSTSWESYGGQVAASRILSSLEATEAGAVIESRGITHIALPSWDRVLPLVVKAPLEPDKTTLFARLDMWKLPPYLRPVPYHLPPAPGYTGQRLALFRVVPPQDEALLVSRIAEYFVEMNRSEPAGLAARVLAEAYAEDPNARVARAGVWVQLKKASEFERELGPIADAVAAGQVPFEWDRRVQRAIILAIGRRHDIARTEVEACLATASPELAYELTALQAHRLAELARRYALTFTDPQVAAIVESLGSEYRASAAPPSR